MFENPRRGRQARNFTTNVSKILDLKSSSKQIFFRKLSLGAPDVIELSSNYFTHNHWLFMPLKKYNNAAKFIVSLKNEKNYFGTFHRRTINLFLFFEK